MSRLHQYTATLVVAAMLTGCGSQVIGATTASPLASGMNAASVATPVADPHVAALIASYRAVTGTDAASMTQRDALIVQLGATNSDAAVAFLQAEYDQTKSYPEALRSTHALAILQALANLDTFDPASDGAILSAGPGNTAASAQSYVQAMAKKKRHNAFIRWATEPLRWVDAGLRWFIRFVNGTSGHKKGGGGNGPGPAPAPAPDPGPPAPAPAPGP